MRRVNVPTGLTGVRKRDVVLASVTPLASIFGSGFLIIVPVLERSLGGLAVVGAVGVSAVAWMIGTAIRHNIAENEPRANDGSLGQCDKRIERMSDVVIAVAYVISVALYLRIMSEYLIEYVSPGSDTATSLVAAGAVALITFVGISRGFTGLDLMERLALGAVMALTTVLGVTYFAQSSGTLVAGDLQIPPVPDVGIGSTLLMLGGIVITVQGFETVRYLGDEYDATTRIWASRLAQVVAAAIYVGFVAVATPLMGLGTPAGADQSLLEITNRVAPILALPLVLCAVLSQFSAATADTVAARENLSDEFPNALGGARAYVLSAVAAIAIIWSVPTLTIVTVASRAFAAYYCLQCVLAYRTARTARARWGFGVLAILMGLIALFAKPLG